VSAAATRGTSSRRSLSRPPSARLLVDQASWRLVFYINLPVGALALALLHVRLPAANVQVPTNRLDVPGAALLASGTTALMQHTAGDPLAHQIHAALKHAQPGGLTRTQLRDLLHRNPTTTQLDRALAALAHDGKITSQRILTNGRPAELWTAAPQR
jgi:hypothetical protein